MARVNKVGFPISQRKRTKQVRGFQTGELVGANVPKGKYHGRWLGRVAIRASGYLDLKGLGGKSLCQGISYKYCRFLQHEDGWYSTKTTLTPYTSEMVHSSTG
ncbi:MAG: hypothetical protein ACFFBD_03280 [Candidatus Hodarchaeota archaeon]